MIIDLIKIEKSPKELNHQFTPDEIDLEIETARLTGEILLAAELNKTSADTEIKGKISADSEIECTRCLSPIEKRLEIPFQAAFIAAENYSEAKETQLKTKDLDVSIIENDEVNVTELVREQILLNLPEQIFCREDCQGLCQKCGANRNLINCNCIEKETDPRWAALNQLKIKN